MGELPPFNPKATCPKCGSDQIATRWKRAKAGQTMPLSEAARADRSEWLMRHCGRCEFNWDEACLGSGDDA
jgi:ribosomal protein S27AE